MQVQFTCLHCGSPFSVKPSRAARGNVSYCSNACHYAAVTTPLVPCEHCGKLFATHPKRQARGWGRYCSKRCSGAARSVPAEERFWAKVTRSDDPDACWLWGGIPAHAFGYGAISVDSLGTKVHTHVYAWLLAAGPIPKGMEIAHTCDVPACVKNDTVGVYEVDGVEYERHGHLFLATQRVNMRDKVLKGRSHGPAPAPARL